MEFVNVIVFWFVVFVAFCTISPKIYAVVPTAFVAFPVTLYVELWIIRVEFVQR